MPGKGLGLFPALLGDIEFDLALLEGALNLEVQFFLPIAHLRGQKGIRELEGLAGHESLETVALLLLAIVSVENHEGS